MGFMKFMKKDNANPDTSLDIPPPPPIDSADSNLGGGENDSFQQGLGDNSLPPLPSAGEMEDKNEGLDGIPPLSEEPVQDDTLPSMQEQKSSFDIPSIRAPHEGGVMNHDSLVSQPVKPIHVAPPVKKAEPPKMPEPKPFEELLEPQLEPHHELQKAEPIEEHNPEDIMPPVSGKQVFIEVGRYKQLLKDLNNIKKSLKKSDDEVGELIGDISDEKNTFSNLHTSLSEIEKKLVELENGLFS